MLTEGDAVSEGNGLRVEEREAVCVRVVVDDFVTSRVRVEDGLPTNIGLDGIAVGVVRDVPVEEREMVAVRLPVVVGAAVTVGSSVGSGDTVGAAEVVGSCVGSGEVVACGETV